MATAFVFGPAEDNLNALALEELDTQEAQMWAAVREHEAALKAEEANAAHARAMDERALCALEWEEEKEKARATYVSNGSLPQEVASRMAARVHMMSEDPQWSCFHVGGYVNDVFVGGDTYWSLGEAITGLEGEVANVRKKAGQQWGPCERLVDPYGLAVYRYTFKDMEGYLEIVEGEDDRWMDDDAHLGREFW